MKQYISNLIPRLKEYSASLDKKEIFIEIPWVIVDSDLNQQKYIFRRDGDLIMSLNGQVAIGKWEYLAAAKSMLIDRIQDKILLNQNFIDPAVMVLKKDGFKDENVIMANENLIPDLNVADYLRKLYYQKNRIVVRQLKNGDCLEISNYLEYSLNNRVTIEGKSVSDCKLELDKSSKKLLIKDSKIIRVLIEKPYNTDNGLIRIEQGEHSYPIIGDLVFQENDFAKDGKYRLGFMNYIIVENGRIVRT